MTPTKFYDLSYELRRTVYLEGLVFWRVDLCVKVEQKRAVPREPVTGRYANKLVVGDRSCIETQLLCELNQVPLLLVSRQVRPEVSNLVWQRGHQLHIRTKGISIGPGCSSSGKWLHPWHTFTKLRDLLHSKPLWRLTDTLSCLSLPFFYAHAVRDPIHNEPWLMPSLQMLLFYDESGDAYYPRHIPTSSRTYDNLTPTMLVTTCTAEHVGVLTGRLHRMTWNADVPRTYEVGVQCPAQDKPAYAGRLIPRTTTA